MPRPPRTATSVQGISGSVFTALARKLRDHPGEVYPFHVGDTWKSPPAGCRMEDLGEADWPGLHRYSQPHGLPALLEATSERVSARTGIETGPDHVMISTGATGGLGAIAGALLEPGDEILLLAPYWPLIAGITRTFRGVPVDVPVDDILGDAEALVGRLHEACSERTVAVYVNTPNNPTGRCLPRETLEAIARWAQTKGLWIIADEVYEDLVYEGRHAYLRSMAPDTTFAAHSFSKAWAMAGNRCGYVVGPQRAMVELQKVGTHSFYSAPTAAQVAACRLLASPAAADWMAETREQYRKLGAEMADAVGVEPPQGGTFLFFDASPRLDERGLEGFLSDCADRGVFLAPGPSFGPYPTHARVCFTAAPPDVTRRGIEVLAQLLSQDGR